MVLGQLFWEHSRVLKSYRVIRSPTATYCVLPDVNAGLFLLERSPTFLVYSIGQLVMGKQLLAAADRGHLEGLKALGGPSFDKTSMNSQALV